MYIILAMSSVKPIIFIYIRRNATLTFMKIFTRELNFETYVHYLALNLLLKTKKNMLTHESTSVAYFLPDNIKTRNTSIHFNRVIVVMTLTQVFYDHLIGEYNDTHIFHSQ